MPDPYTYVSKPTSSTYNFINFQGKQMYDQSDLTYDDANVFYDSYDPNAYTLVAKPTNSVYTYIAKPTS